MKININETKENPLLHRKEIRMTLEEFKETPNKKDVISELAKTTNADEKLIVVKEIRQEYGMNRAYCYAKVYENEDYKNTYERVKKSKESAEKKEEAPKPEEKKEEKPKEEPKKEEKKEGEPKKED